MGREEDLSRVLYEQHAEDLLAYVQRLMHGDRQLAEDIVQETLLRAWRRGGDVPPESRRPWLFVTARRLVIDAYRARRSRPPEVAAELLEISAEDHGLDAALDAVLLADALQTLSAEHRSVLFESFYEGRTARQIALARGIPPGTVRSRMHYALRALRLALQERGVNGP
ncbi:MAG TPA: sigma-70 family RNA polymerase sigma factor [Nocardioides sp.]